MNAKLQLTLGLLVLTLGASSSRAGFNETWVEPYNKDCTGTPQAIAPQSFGYSVARDLDNDTRFDGTSVGGYDENGDSDAIFQTLAAALSNTNSGGVIYLATGFYREAVTISDSVTIKGPADRSAVLDGACSGGTLARGIDISAGGEAIVLENLTVQGYTNEGVRCDGSALKMINCRVQANGGAGIQAPNAYQFELHDSEVISNVGDGISQPDGSPNWLIADSLISNNDDGLYSTATTGTAIVILSNSRVVRNADDGVFLEVTQGAVALSSQGSEVAGNGGDGLQVQSRNTGRVALSDSVVEGNVGDGLALQNNGGCTIVGGASLKGIVTDSRILANGGDGIEVSGTGSGCSVGYTAAPTEVSVYQNTLAFNAGYALKASTTSSLFTCTVGRNQISYNVAGAQSGGSWCGTVDNENQNQMP